MQQVQWTKICLGAFAGLALLWLVLGLATAKDDLQASKSSVTFMSEQDVSRMRLKSISKIEEGTNAEWLPVLRHGKVVQILDIDEETTGLASKYKVVFESGHQALAKFAEPYRFLEPQWALETIQNAQLDESLYPRRAGRKMQAWPEVAASAVARVAMPGRKVPVAMRQFSSKDWYGCQKCNGWMAWLKYWLPEHTVYVSVQAWIDRVRTTQPSVEYYKLLVSPPAPHMRPSNYSPGQAGLISDTIVFDYLVDDHDRLKGHNWVSDGYNNLLLWDNGLSFNHGPLGRTSCMDLLCGPDKWKEFGKETWNLGKRDRCRPICKFRRKTVERLRLLGPQADEGRQLGALALLELDQETAPVFEFNEYYPYNARYPKMKFIRSDFALGLNHRIARFLSHVEDCISDFGEEFVLDTSLEVHGWAH